MVRVETGVQSLTVDRIARKDPLPTSAWPVRGVEIPVWDQLVPSSRPRAGHLNTPQVGPVLQNFANSVHALVSRSRSASTLHQHSINTPQVGDSPRCSPIGAMQQTLEFLGFSNGTCWGEKTYGKLKILCPVRDVRVRSPPRLLNSKGTWAYWHRIRPLSW